MTERSAILQEREKTHGSFAEVARISQELKSIFHKTPSWYVLPHRMREAIEMDCTKKARILAGNPHDPDHWNDIAGYAELGAEACD